MNALHMAAQGCEIVVSGCLQQLYLSQNSYHPDKKNHTSQNIFLKNDIAYLLERVLDYISQEEISQGELQGKFLNFGSVLNFPRVIRFYGWKLKSCHFLRTCTMFEQRSA